MPRDTAAVADRKRKCSVLDLHARLTMLDQIISMATCQSGAHFGLQMATMGEP